MQFFVALVALLINLHISQLESANCNKTHSQHQPTVQVLPSTGESTSVSRNATIKFESDLIDAGGSSVVNNNRLELGAPLFTSAPGSEHQLNSNDLNLLRVEYNKYKILSSLGLNINPEPILDDELRYKLTASTKFSENSREKGRNVSVCRQVDDCAIQSCRI